MGLPEGQKRFKIGLAVLIQYRRVTDSQPATHVAVTSTRYAHLSCAVKGGPDKHYKRTHKTNQC